LYLALRNTQIAKFNHAPLVDWYDELFFLFNLVLVGVGRIMKVCYMAAGRLLHVGPSPKCCNTDARRDYVAHQQGTAAPLKQGVTGSYTGPV